MLHRLAAEESESDSLASRSSTSKSDIERRDSGSTTGSQSSGKKNEDQLARWLRDGTVVFKCVGLGLMDLVIGTHLIKVAQEKKIGTQIEGF